MNSKDLFPYDYGRLGDFIDNREARRQLYRPDVVRVLLIGESMPAGGDFFYNADSALFRFTQQAFSKVFGSQCGIGETFLTFFQDKGCYLDDLCPIPVDRFLPPKRLIARKKSIPLLAERLRAYEPAPERIIIIMKDIALDVLAAIRKAGLKDVETKELPLPVRSAQNQDDYVEGLARAIQVLL